MNQYLWKTHRGDEWWYSDHDCNASGSYINTFFEIIKIKPKNNELDAEIIKRLILVTKNEFPNLDLLILLNKEIEKILNQLQESNFVNWVVVQHPYSRSARILSYQNT